MFRKLLKYDCKAIWKIFAICAATSLFFSGVCGILLRKMITGFGDLFAEEADAVATGVTNIIAGEILMILAILSFYGVILAASVFTIFLLYRFYADLYTDVGYLTFTLPVSRRTLLNEKITHYLLWSLAIGGVIACGIKIITLFTPSLPADALAELEGVMATVLSYLGACTWLFGFEGVVIYLLMTVLTALIAFFCITVGSVVAKKHKLLVSIGIYYGFSIALGIGLSVLISIGTLGVAGGLSIIGSLSQTEVKWILSLVITGAIVLIGALDVMLYHMTLSKMEYKLNLP